MSWMSMIVRHKGGCWTASLVLKTQKHRHWQDSGITTDQLVFLDDPDEVLEEIGRIGVVVGPISKELIG